LRNALCDRARPRAVDPSQGVFEQCAPRP
jgi:hypothetical protein